MCQGFIDRAGYRSTFWRTYIDEEKKLGNFHVEQFEKVDKETCFGTRPGSYEKIDEDGIVQPGERVSADDVLISKTSPMPPQPKSKFTKRDHSLSNRSTERGIVDRSMLSTNADGFKFAKVRVRSMRVPEVGDKFSSRHGQKGTIGMIFPTEDMPFSPTSGMVPDIIINAHAIPSRMTIGHLLESEFAKAGCYTNGRVDATIFEHHDREKEAEAVLHAKGFQKYGKERLVNGQTGRMMDCMIFMGPVYYQRLKHLVADKIHSRSRGANNMLTRQPVEGRVRDGGLRFGKKFFILVITHSLLNNR
jgi:DNA-directed RNA polymerase II subunit RPB2